MVLEHLVAEAPDAIAVRDRHLAAAETVVGPVERVGLAEQVAVDVQLAALRQLRDVLDDAAHRVPAVLGRKRPVDDLGRRDLLGRHQRPPRRAVPPRLQRIVQRHAVRVDQRPSGLEHVGTAHPQGAVRIADVPPSDHDSRLVIEDVLGCGHVQAGNLRRRDDVGRTRIVGPPFADGGGHRDLLGRTRGREPDVQGQRLAGPQGNLLAQKVREAAQPGLDVVPAGVEAILRVPSRLIGDECPRPAAGEIGDRDVGSGNRQALRVGHETADAALHRLILGAGRQWARQSEQQGCRRERERHPASVGGGETWHVQLHGCGRFTNGRRVMPDYRTRSPPPETCVMLSHRRVRASRRVETSPHADGTGAIAGWTPILLDCAGQPPDAAMAACLPGTP